MSANDLAELKTPKFGNSCYFSFFLSGRLG